MKERFQNAIVADLLMTKSKFYYQKGRTLDIKMVNMNYQVDI